MKNLIKKYSLAFIGIVLVVVIIVIILIVIKIGGAYRNGISQIGDQPPIGNSTHIIKKKINKIILKKSNDDKGCIEITNDGIVRTYDICGTQLASASRMTDTNNIIRLFKIAGETDYSTESMSEDAIAKCSGYIMMIETEDGKRTICTKSGSSGTGGGTGGGNPIDDIVDTIKKIIEDIPPTPTPVMPTITPIPTIVISGTPEPTLPFVPSDIMTPTPTPVILKQFTCGYSIGANGTKHPYDVSNTICTDQPIPGQ
jgi:hypothetical protein